MNETIECEYVPGEMERLQQEASLYEKKWHVAPAERQFTLVSGRPVMAVGDEVLKKREGKGWSIAAEGPEWSRSPDTSTFARAPDDSFFVYSFRSFAADDLGQVHRVDETGCTLVSDDAPPRSYAGLAWSPSDGLVLFGGEAPHKSGVTPPSSDTFALKGKHWKKLAAKGPAARAQATLVGTRRGVLMWGGADKKSKVLTDCWLLENGVWRPQPSAAGDKGQLPVTRSATAVVLDDDKVLNFDFRPDALVATLWNGSSWQQVAELEMVAYARWWQLSLAIDLTRKSLLLHVPAADDRATRPESHILEAVLTALLARVSAIPFVSPAHGKGPGRRAPAAKPRRGRAARSTR